MCLCVCEGVCMCACVHTPVCVRVLLQVSSLGLFLIGAAGGGISVLNTRNISSHSCVS